MQKVHDALSGSSSDSFSFKIAHVDGNLAVTCSWANPNAPGNLRATISLDRSPEAQQICLQFLRPLTLNHSILLENLRLAERICQGFRREAETAQQQVADFVLKKEQLEDELYVKFAALLNEKKGKLKEWRQKAEDWERRALAAERRLELVEGGETERDDSAATQMSEEEDGASDTALPQGEGPDKSGRPALDSGGSMPSNTRSLPIAGGASMLRDSLPADLATADTLPLDMDLDGAPPEGPSGADMLIKGENPEDGHGKVKVEEDNIRGREPLPPSRQKPRVMAKRRRA